MGRPVARSAELNHPSRDLLLMDAPERNTSGLGSLLARGCSPGTGPMVRWAALAMTVLCWSTVVVWAATASPPARGRELSESERQILARSLAWREPQWQRAAERAFPGDLWSEDDDFFNQEQNSIRDLAERFGTTPGAILRGIDELLRHEPGSRKVGVHPCKPRPFYD